MNPKTGRAIITDANAKGKNWRTAVATKAAEVIETPIQGPLYVRFEFTLPRPKGHFTSGKNAGHIKDSSPVYPAVKPDTTKLVRSTEDALRAIAWIDDSQIVEQFASKKYNDDCPIGVKISIELLSETIKQKTLWDNL